MKTYRICWLAKRTGATGHGEFIFTEAQARQTEKELNDKYGKLVYHWVEPRMDDPTEAEPKNV